ncbi:hypothetical protein F4703DRAFT_1859369 [Phycomyces blakesleeanus]
MFSFNGQEKNDFIERTRAERKKREQEKVENEKEKRRTAAAVRIQQWWRNRQRQKQAIEECWQWWDANLSSNDHPTTMNDIFSFLGFYCLFSRNSTLEQIKNRLPIICRLAMSKAPGDRDNLTLVSFHTLLIDARYMARAQRYLCIILHQSLVRTTQNRTNDDNFNTTGTTELNTLLHFLNPNTFKVQAPIDPKYKVDNPANVLKQVSLRVIKETILSYSTTTLRDSAIVRVAHVVKLEEQSKKHSRGVISTENAKIIQTIKLWLTTLTRLILFTVEHSSDTNKLWSKTDAVVFVGNTVLQVPLLTTMVHSMMVSHLPTWSLYGNIKINDLHWIETIEGNGALFLLANSVDVWQKQQQANLNHHSVTDLIQATNTLFSVILPFYSDRQMSFYSTYHPVFKWSSCTWGNSIHSNVYDRVMKQLEFLWSRTFMDKTFEPILSFEPKTESSKTNSTKKGIRSSGSPLFTTFNSKKKQQQQQEQKQEQKLHLERNPLCGQLAEFSVDVENIFSMYINLGTLFPDQKKSILARITFTPGLVRQLWKVMNTFGPRGQMLIYLDAANKKNGSEIEKEPLIKVLKVFCEVSSLVFLTLDDTDIFQKENPFSSKVLIELSSFLNAFYFALVQQQGSTPTSLPDSVHSFHSARRLLLQLYDLDLRHPFCPQKHWQLVTDPSTKSNVLSLFNSSASSSSKTSEFLTHFRQGDMLPLRILQLMPHTVSFDTRLKIFRDWIHMDRATSNAGRSRVITVRRNFVLEDGLRGLSNLSPTAWKGTIRVSFVNELGIEEAGIDQGGPFKDFISLLVAEVFKPSCELFAATPKTNLFYPAASSHIIGASHVAYFELIGKIIGKAVYEGILIDAQFASFLLSKLLGRNVFLEELRELDEDIWRNLTFVKHQDNIEDLGLTFATDEQINGKVVTHELKFLGSQTAVTDSNKVEYVYLMADYKLNQQAKEQTKAFINGFRSVIFDGWIKVFSPPELQRVISGEDTDFDVHDLRRHTDYQNGYFDQHPVIKLMWQIVDGLTSQEKRAFLKFVTGCPKPPLGGFDYLQPPFTIRMVSPDKDQQSMEGLGIVKSFFKINGLQNKGGRLPTSSTCFNLLKLPAFHANTGFELS